MIRNITGKDSRVYQNIFLDLDGTVTESGRGCLNGVRYMFDKMGYEENDEQKMLKFLGPPILQHLMQAYGLDEQQAKTAYAYYKEYYDSTGLFENRLYDGIKDAITAIRDAGKNVYLATSKPEHLALQILERFDVRDLFTDIFAARHDLGVYDKNQVLRRAIEILGHVPAGPVMVGDRCYDIAGGQSAGFDTVGVLYGYGDLDELTQAGCDYIVDSVQDLSVMFGGNSI